MIKDIKPIIKKNIIKEKRKHNNILRRIFYTAKLNENLASIINSKLEKDKINYAEQKLNVATKEVDNAEKKGKNKLWTWLFLILNLLIVATILIRQIVGGKIQPLSSLLSDNPNWVYLIIAILFCVLALILEGLKISELIFASTKKVKFKLGFNTASVGRYYDSITPLSSGGEPAQIVYLNTHGVSGELSTGIPLARQFFWQINFVVMGLIILIYSAITNAFSNVIIWAAWIGIIGNAVLFGITLLISTNKKVGLGLTIGVLKLLHKMHIIKNYRKTFVKVLNFVKEYQSCIKLFVKNIWCVIGGLALAVASSLALYSIPYFIYLGFNTMPTISWWEIVCKIAICDMAVSFIPIPGGTGVSEISFTAMFASMFSIGSFFWALLLWRILTYYVYIAQGLITIIVGTISRKKPIEKLQRYGKSAETVQNNEDITIIEED